MKRFLCIYKCFFVYCDQNLQISQFQQWLEKTRLSNIAKCVVSTIIHQIRVL